MTEIRKVVHLNAGGNLERLRDGEIINAGGTSYGNFTVGGRGLLFDDGTSTSGGHSVLNLQSVYEASADNVGNATIKLQTGKDLVIYDDTNNQVFFKVDAETGTVTITGDLRVSGTQTVINSNVEDSDHWQITPASPAVTALKIEPDAGVTPLVDLVTIRRVNAGPAVLRVDKDGNTILNTLTVSGDVTVSGLINGLSINQINATLTNHLIYDGTAKHSAREISCTPTPVVPNAYNVQKAIDDLSVAIQNAGGGTGGGVGLGYEHVQATGAKTWTISHNLHTKRITFTVYDHDDNMILPDTAKKLDIDTLQVTFSGAQVGSVVIMGF